MAVRETIALVGIADEGCRNLISKLARENYRLLLVSDNVNLSGRLSEQVMQDTQGAEVETIDCVKNGCWEADIIALVGAANFEEERLNRIKVFATQKIVVGISVHHGKTAAFEVKNIQRLLPHSKVVHVFNTSGSMKAFMGGDDPEAVEAIADMATKVGYHPITVDGLQSITTL